jgi:hypothetical protein
MKINCPLTEKIKLVAPRTISSKRIMFAKEQGFKLHQGATMFLEEKKFILFREMVILHREKGLKLFIKVI